ncbi:unnamed protein product [Miscanthus lutarioriparius]|uniref:Uncharacterized protein n=1 Tax=Miscanthus lutarioriparius TaxID=422564 RepID=A0A811NQ46_9POAL|nr:unnamed protein product [Miscanthus lutarioriparius]
MASFNQESRAAPQREEAPVQSKYGGISPKKPLINKDRERAYFDSADWVLGKQGASSNSTTTVLATTEPLKPKLQSIPHGHTPSQHSPNGRANSHLSMGCWETKSDNLGSGAQPYETVNGPQVVGSDKIKWFAIRHISSWKPLLEFLVSIHKLPMFDGAAMTLPWA